MLHLIQYPNLAFKKELQYFTAVLSPDTSTARRQKKNRKNHSDKLLNLFPMVYKNCKLLDLTSIFHILSGGVIFKFHSPGTHIASCSIELDRGSKPICQPKVRVDRWGWRLQAGNPVTCLDSYQKFAFVVT